MNETSHSPTANIAVSVIIPVFNAAEHLRECINSVVQQSLKNIEVIMVNDASTDNSKEILESFTGTDKRCKLVNLHSNRGLPAARNAGVEVASGEFIIHLDSDDFWLESKTLEVLYTTARLENTEILRFNGFDFINNDLAGTIIPSYPAVNVDLVSTPQLWIFRSVFLYLFQSEFLKKHHLKFDPSISIGEDAIFLSKALPKAKRVSSIPSFFYAYRRHEQSMMGNHWKLQGFEQDQSSSDIVIENLRDNPEIAKFYVFSRYTDYWINKLLPRARQQLDRQERYSMYERYRKTIVTNAAVFRPRSRLGLRFRIAKWLLIRNHFALLDFLINSLSPRKRLSYFSLGHFLNLITSSIRHARKIQQKWVSVLKRSTKLRNLLQKGEETKSKVESIEFNNDESHQEFNFTLDAAPKISGVSAMLRVKNEETNIVRCIESILPFFDEIVVVDNGSTDNTAALLNELIQKHGSSANIRSLSYPFEVSRCGLQHSDTGENSVHNLAYYYNWCLSQCKMTHVVKWDADMIFIDSWIAIIEFRSYLHNLMTETSGALGAFCVQTLYLDKNGKPFTTSEEIHSEVRIFPNEPSIHYKKGTDWEVLHHPRFRNVVRSERVFAYEIKDTCEPEFDHWSEISFKGWRKSLEYRNFQLVKADLHSVERGFRALPDLR